MFFFLHSIPRSGLIQALTLEYALDCIFSPIGADMKNPSFLQIGEVAKNTGLSIHTIRYYEKRGLLMAPPRKPGGFRLYPAETVERLQFIQKAQDLGLTLKEITEITCCGDKGLGPCCDLTVNLFSKKIHEFEEKSRELNRMKKKLKTVLGGWAGKRKVRSKK